MLHKDCSCTASGKLKMSQLDFRRKIAISYLRSSSCISAYLLTSPALVPQSIRNDDTGRLNGPMGNTLSCLLDSCSLKAACGANVRTPFSA